MTNRKELIIFDLDDTLVDTSHVYWTARQGFIDTLVQLGADANYVLELFESVDEKNIKTMGFVPERYEQTMIEAYEFLVDEGRVKKSAATEESIRQHGKIVLNQLPELIEGANQLLAWASGRFKLVLMTRGIESLQKRKIAYSEIAQYFDDIRIVAKKDASHFRAVVYDSGYLPETTWVIGDSIRSDINPALEAGTRCILYQYTHHTYYWRQEYGVDPIQPFFKVDKLEEAISILKGPCTARMITPQEWKSLIQKHISTGPGAPIA